MESVMTKRFLNRRGSEEERMGHEVGNQPPTDISSLSFEFPEDALDLHFVSQHEFEETEKNEREVCTITVHL